MTRQTPSIRLRIVTGSDAGREITLERPVVTLGKLSSSTLRLSGDMVSRRHAVIERRADGHWRLTDLGSTHGTQVNGARVVQAELASGDRLCLGDVALDVHFEANTTLAALRQRGRRAAPTRPDAAPAPPPLPPLPAAPAPIDAARFYDRVARPSGDRPQVLEVALLWGETILSVEHLARPRRVTLGEHPGCQFSVPAELLGRPSFDLIEPRGDGFALNLTNPRITGDLLVAGAVTTVAELVAAGRAPAGRYLLAPGAKARLHLGDVSLLLSLGAPVERPKVAPLRARDLTPLSFLALSLILHSAFLIVLQMLPDEQLRSHQDPARRRAQMMQVMKVTRAAEEPRAPRDDPKPDPVEAADRDRLTLDEAPTAVAKAPAPREALLDKIRPARHQRSELAGLTPAERKQRARELTKTLGAAAAVSTSLMDTLLERDQPLPKDGRMVALSSRGGPADFGAALDPFGGDGLTGPGGGFVGGDSLTGPTGPTGPGGDPGPGLVAGLDDRRRPDDLRRVHMTAKEPRPKAIAHDPRVVGGLDKATVGKIIRRNLGGVRWCYQDALQAQGGLNGKVAISFNILPDGRVSAQRAHSSAIANAGLMRCIENKVARFRFPPATNGRLTRVTYPVLLKVAR